MAYTNNATLIRRELIMRLSKLIMEDKLDDIDRIPLEIAPRNAKQESRCCPHKTRAVLKYRIMALLGFNVSDEEDELTTLKEYTLKAMKGGLASRGSLTVVDEACTSCHKKNYVVSNLCRGCVARPCMVNCPKESISIIDGQARIDASTCVNCGICKNECPYHAIIYVPIPCEEVCPVDAISKDEDGIEHIDYDKCIHCGRCLTACPFGAIMSKSDLVGVLGAIKSGKPTVAMVAPSVLGQFKAEFEQVVEAIKHLGFADVIEVAAGAVSTATHEAEELVEKIEGGQKFMTTSCCPSYVEAVRLHMPELQEFVSHTPTPMNYTAKIAKEKYPDCATVFFGPCIAKKIEAKKDPNVDFVMTFEELGALMLAENIDVNDFPAMPAGGDIPQTGRWFAESGGVTRSVLNYMSPDFPIKKHTINGLDRKQIAFLRKFPKLKLDTNFIEVMACEGGCIGGPGNMCNPKVGKKLLSKYMEE